MFEFSFKTIVKEQLRNTSLVNWIHLDIHCKSTMQQVHHEIYLKLYNIWFQLCIKIMISFMCFKSIFTLLSMISKANNKLLAVCMWFSWGPVIVFWWEKQYFTKHTWHKWLSRRANKMYGCKMLSKNKQEQCIWEHFFV